VFRLAIVIFFFVSLLLMNFDYDKSVIVMNQAQVRGLLQRAEANSRAFSFFLTDTMHGRRTNHQLVDVQTFCLDALFRTSNAAKRSRAVRS